jgi:hypothetical protein
METVARDVNCLFRKFLPFLAFETIQNSLRLRINTMKLTKYTWEEHGVYGDSVKVTAINEIHKAFVSVYFVSEGHMTQPPTLKFVKM